MVRIVNLSTDPVQSITATRFTEKLKFKIDNKVAKLVRVTLEPISLRAEAVKPAVLKQSDDHTINTWTVMDLVFPRQGFMIILTKR